MQNHHNQHVQLLNYLFEIEKKAARIAKASTLSRPIFRMKSTFEDMGYILIDPRGEPYNSTRMDVEASIMGDKMEELTIVDVIKPIIYLKEDDSHSLIQKGVVLVS